MKSKQIFASMGLGFFFLSSVTFLGAEEVKGLVQEFMEVEDFLSKNKPSAEQRKKILEKNLLDSLRSTLSRKYAAGSPEIQKISMNDVNYERPQNTFKFYVKYKSYYIYYSFLTDPELYFQLPQEEILYVKPDSFDKNGPHKEETQVMPAPAK
jgi:hypothetical protein